MLPYHRFGKESMKCLEETYPMGDVLLSEEIKTYIQETKWKMEEERMSKLNREQTITYDKKYNQHPWLKGNTEPIPIEKAEGIFFYDFNGKKYYDMSSQLS